MDKLIYSKTYPKYDWDREGESMGQRSILCPPDMPEPSLEEFYEDVKRHISMSEIPGRAAGKERFMELAKELSENFKFSIKIFLTERGVRVELTLDFDQYMDGGLNRLIGLGDNIMISPGCDGRDVEITLTYDVLGVYRDGKLVFPEILAE